MVEDNDLKDMADKMELPLKEGAWEFIEAQIPYYPTRRRWLFFWRYFGAGLVLTALIVALYFESASSSSTTDALASKAVSSSSSDINMRPDDANSQVPGTASQSVVPPSSPVLKPTIANKQAMPKKRTLKTLFTGPQTTFSNADISTNLSAVSDESITPSSNTLNTVSEEDANAQYLMLIRIKRYFNHFNFDQTLVPRISQDNRGYNFYFGLNYGVLSTNIHIEPELMKLPKGKGGELSLYTGLANKKWKFALGIHSAQFRQTTSMGDQHDTTYMQVFRPNFETVLPSEYVGRLHDTASLYLAGTNHNKVNQNFKVFGLSLNVSRTLIQNKKMGLDLSYGANYKLLTKANTFFYDSINKAAVPFTQLDKGIVFKHLMSSRVRLAVSYKINKALAFEVAPFVDYFHKPFIKHYYKADLLNYGLSFGLNYTLR